MEKNKLLPFDLDSYPLNLKTSSEVGSGHKITVGLTSTDHTGQNYTYFKLELSNPPTVTLGHCLNKTDITPFGFSSSDLGEDEWTLQKSTTSIKLLLNLETVFKLNFVENGEKCEVVGLKNVIWLFFASNANDAANLQYKPHIRGTFTSFFKYFTS